MRTITKAIFPEPPYLFVANVVVLEVVDSEEVSGCEVPGDTCPWTAGIEVIDPIDTPVLSRIPLK